ncbi:ABC transporter permease [Inquilinus sp. NPDC058860]|uniref:ABC transporter permease n=1 Tax=Inquilinus sp. NPDC058860 TaxID=3346652 RepID=UPI003682FFCA
MSLSFRRLARRHAEIGILLIAAALVIAFASTSGGRWANSYNFASIAQVTATLAIMSIGVALVMCTGEIDISVGSVFGFSALIYLGTSAHLGTVPAALLGIGTGAAIGLMNGFLVTWFRAPSLIITLSTLMIFRGLSVAVTEGFSFSVPYASRSGLLYQILGGGKLLGVNVAFWWLALILAVASVFVYATPQGNRLLAVGGSAATAHSRGIRVDRVKVSAFILSGTLAALAGVLEGGKLGFADGGLGQLSELQAIAACVLGGCALAGGRVTLIGVVAGAFTLSSVQSYLVVNGVRPQWFIFLLGLIVVVAAMGDRALRDWALRGR